MTDPFAGNELARALGRWAGRGASIEDVTRLPGGASKETWSFDAVAPDGGRTELIMRRDPPGRPSEPGALERESSAISIAHDAGLPVPELLFSFTERAGGGAAGMIMRRVPGETIARKILRDEGALTGESLEPAAIIRPGDLHVILLIQVVLLEVRQEEDEARVVVYPKITGRRWCLPWVV